MPRNTIKPDTAQITFRFPAGLRETLETIADNEGYTISDVMRDLLLAGARLVEQHGYDAVSALKNKRNKIHLKSPTLARRYR